MATKEEIVSKLEKLVLSQKSLKEISKEMKISDASVRALIAQELRLAGIEDAYLYACYSLLNQNNNFKLYGTTCAKISKLSQ